MHARRGQVVVVVGRVRTENPQRDETTAPHRDVPERGGDERGPNTPGTRVGNDGHAERPVGTVVRVVVGGRVVGPSHVGVADVVGEETGRVGAGMFEIEPHRVAECGVAVVRAHGVVDARDARSLRRETRRLDLAHRRFGHRTRVP